ncbi:MAG: hypothetical protein M5U26_24945 [Planctomycetota bacterium]|nr:hypothetical protein [Planctomycetota bacterium]
MPHSSIFSFEAFRGFGFRFPATLLGVAALIFGLELGLRLTPDAWLYASSRSRLGVFSFFEREVIPRFPDPRILVLGSSRAEDAVVPKQLDEALGLPDFSAENLGIQAGDVHDALVFYRRHRNALGRARLVILCTDEWHFSSGAGLGWRYRLHAPISERWALGRPGAEPEWARPEQLDEPRWGAELEARRAAKREQAERLRTQLLLDGIFSMRQKLAYVPTAVAFNLLGLGKNKGLDFTEERQIRRPERKRDDEFGPAIDNPATFDNRLQTFYADFDAHPVLLGHVEALARMVAEDGGRLVLLQMPNRRLYQEEVERLYPAEYELHARALRELGARLGARVYLYRYPEECGLEDRNYLDYGHLAKAGSRRFTEFLAELIRREELLLAEP